MELSKLELMLLDSVEFQLGLLSALPVPVYVVNDSDDILPLNTNRLGECSEKYCCAHESDEDCNAWKLRNDRNCVFCDTVEEARKSGLKASNKGDWRVCSEEKVHELIVVVHAVPVNISANKFVVVALEDVTSLEKLKGLLPICMNCKSIYEEDSGEWVKFAEYITDRSSARFSHGICPDCAKLVYKDIDDN